MNTVSERRWWAYHKGETLGPYASQDEAVAAGRAKWARDFMVGYGSTGAWFGMRF